MSKDLWGLPLSTESPRAAEQYVLGVEKLLSANVGAVLLAPSAVWALSGGKGLRPVGHSPVAGLPARVELVTVGGSWSHIPALEREAGP